MNALFESYFEKLRDKRVAVVGLGVSNVPLIHLLRERDIEVICCDKNKSKDYAELVEMGAILSLGEDYLDPVPDCDVIFRSPGIRPDLPQFLEAVNKGAVLTSEMEAFFEVCPCPIIAVTGSDGKTTTTTLIYEMLKADGKTAHLGGNIGRPLLADAPAMEPGHFAVIELSSFQLMTMKRSPHIAVVTNVTPNHLDIHLSMEEYVQAKENIINYQSAGDIAVFNLDNDIAERMSQKAKGEIRAFSHCKCRRSFVNDDDKYIYVKGVPRVIKSEIKIPGLHNVENYMAAIAAVYDLVAPETIVRVAREFGGVEHRIELVRELDGVLYYNDSIASSPARAIAGLRSFDQKVIMIAGGSDKNIPFDELGREILTHVKHLVLCGATAEKIRRAVETAADDAGSGGVPGITLCADYREVLDCAREIAGDGDVVILSPACASFDMFENFARRGEFFKELVRKLK